MTVQYKNFVINDTTVTNSLALLDGGAIYLDNQGVSLNISNSQFINLTARDSSGGFAYVKMAKNFKLYSTKVHTSSSIEGHLMTVISTATLNVQLEYSKFKCRSEDFEENDVLNSLVKTPLGNGSAIFVKQAYRFDMIKNVFQNCLYADKGGVLRITDSNLTD